MGNKTYGGVFLAMLALGKWFWPVVILLVVGVYTFGETGKYWHDEAYFISSYAGKSAADLIKEREASGKPKRTYAELLDKWKPYTEQINSLDKERTKQLAYFECVKLAQNQMDNHYKWNVRLWSDYSSAKFEEFKYKKGNAETKVKFLGKKDGKTFEAICNWHWDDFYPAKPNRAWDFNDRAYPDLKTYPKELKYVKASEVKPPVDLTPPE